MSRGTEAVQRAAPSDVSLPPLARGWTPQQCVGWDLSSRPVPTSQCDRSVARALQKCTGRMRAQTLACTRTVAGVRLRIDGWTLLGSTGVVPRIFRVQAATSFSPSPVIGRQPPFLVRATNTPTPAACSFSSPNSSTADCCFPSFVLRSIVVPSLHTRFLSSFPTPCNHP